MYDSSVSRMVSVGCSPHHISGGAPQLGSGLATQCVGTSRLVVILPIQLYYIR
jgi:hypothetical protein